MNEENLPHTIKTCFECHTPLGPGRSDRKFCNDICRTAFNNKRRGDGVNGESNAPGQIKPLHQKIFSTIVHNRNLLEIAYYYDEETSWLSNLLKEGFNLKYFTSEYTSPQGTTYRCCLDFGYHVRENGGKSG